MSLSPARPALRRGLVALALAGSTVAVSGVALVGPASAGTLAGTAAAADPAPSAAGTVVVVGSSSYTNGSSSSPRLTVVGEVRNDWDRVTTSPHPTVELLDAAGTVLDTEKAYATFSQLAPGERSTFSGTYPVPAGFASYRVTAPDRSSAYDSPNHRFQVAVTSDTPTSSGRLIKGTVKNLNTAEAAGVQVDVQLRDASGALYDDETTYVKGTGTDGALAAGETVPFELTHYTGAQPYEADGTITAAAESYSAPAPFETELQLTTPARVAAGANAHVEARVYGKGTIGSAPKGITVQLLGREAGQSAFKVVRSGVTSGSTLLTWDLKPQHDIRWQLRVLPTATAAAATSAATLTQVAFGVSTTGTTSGGTATLRGTVLPASAGAPVYLQQQVSGSFRNVASYALSRSSTYVFTLKKPRGRYVYRVYKPARTGNQAGTGPVMVLTVY